MSKPLTVAEAMVTPLRVWVTHAGYSHRRATLAREALDAFVAALTERDAEHEEGAL